MKRLNRLNALIFAAALALTAALSAAAGYGAGVAEGTNMRLAYPSFYALTSRPVKPDMNDEADIERYEREGKEYAEAAELYLTNAMADIKSIFSESDSATAEVNDFIAEYNQLMQERY